MFKENPNLTARQAGSLLKAELQRRNLAFAKVKSRSISFQDLARYSRIFAGIEGWVSHPTAYGELKAFAAEHGFYIEILTHADGSAVWS